ncbi:MAG TPA: tail fiber domain-containing protein [Pyrinomonadaceae bacterium]
MKHTKYFTLAVVAAAVFTFAQIAEGQTEGKLANMSVGGGSVRWDIAVSNAGGTLTITAPDGRSFRKAFRGGASPEINLSDKQLDGLPDGVYNYELQLTPVLTGAQKEALMKARGSDDDPENERAARKRPSIQALSQSGSFAILNGALVGPGAIEGQRTASQTAAPQPTRVSANTVERLRNHRFSLLRTPDIVQADDVIIQGSLCVGLDCVNNESFGFDTIRLKENNTRIKFDDTSTGAGFPNHDWQLTANDSANGGANKFSIEDISASTVPVTVTGSAPTNSVFVASNGKVGFGTSAVALNLHVSATDTPAIRQEQTSAGGFTAQTWDIGGNEANWFVRDVTGGSRLPFRIRPGAPTSSIDINASGLVGIGTASPSQKLHTFISTGNVFHLIESGGTGAAANIYRRSGSSDWVAGQGAASANANYEVASNGAADATWNMNGQQRLMIQGSSGNVGINTASPDQKLSVNGDADKTGGNTWLSFSDERLKNIKGRFNSGLSAVMRLQPIRYEYKKDNALGLKSEGEHIGFGAQAVQKIIPEAVTKNSAGYLMVNGDPIMWTMLNAIKEQQKEIEQLKGQIKKLQTPSRRHRR